VNREQLAVHRELEYLRQAANEAKRGESPSKRKSRKKHAQARWDKLQKAKP